MKIWHITCNTPKEQQIKTDTRLKRRAKSRSQDKSMCNKNIQRENTSKDKKRQ